MTRFRFFISQLSSTPVYCAGKLVEVGRIGLNMVKYLNSPNEIKMESSKNISKAFLWNQIHET